jgi:hypothetical protein
MFEPELKALLDSPFVGIPSCKSCSQPIQLSGRFVKELNLRKLKVVQVFDKYFALKSNLAQTKKVLLEKLEGTKFFYY